MNPFLIVLFLVALIVVTLAVVRKQLGLVLPLLLAMTLLVFVVGFVPAPPRQVELSDLPEVPVLEIGGILLAGIIVAVVELAKKLGLPTQYAPWLNGALSLVGYGLMILVKIVPGSESYVVYGLNALIIFLSAAGLYDRAQATVLKRGPKSAY